MLCWDTETKVEYIMCRCINFSHLNSHIVLTLFEICLADSVFLYKLVDVLMKVLCNSGEREAVDVRL